MYNKKTTKAYVALFLIAVFVMITPTSFAQSSEIPELFSDILPSNDLLSQNFMTPYSTQFQLVSADISALDSDQISVTMFGETSIITKDRTTVRDTNDFTWFGSGDGINAVLVVDGTEIIGSIDIDNKSFSIRAIDSDSVHIIQEIDIATIPSEYGYANDENAYDEYALTAIVTSEMNLLEDAYIGGRDYSDNKIIIDIFGAYTDAFDDNVRNPHSEIIFAIEKANDSYNDNHLPLELNLVDDGRARGYIEVSVSQDLDNLQDPNVDEFDRVRAVAENEDADALILFTSYFSDNSVCGKAADILSDTADSSYAVVRDVCISTHTLAHELGHLQGARHDNIDDPNTTPFAYGHGWFDLSIRQKTIMSTDIACDDPRTPETEICTTQGLWSDPFDHFIGSASPAGTTDTNWNAKVLFVTGPHIASLRGDTQTYDDSPPTGAITTSPAVIIPSSTVSITATFNEEIHPNYTPKIIISDIDDGIVTTADMTRVSETVYTHSHILTSESGTVDLSFSTARDIYGNDVVAIPTSGGSFTIIIPDTTAPRIDTINRQNPLEESTDDSTLTFRVTFDEDVTGVDFTDFITGGTATSSVSSLLANSAVQYDVNVSVTADGTVSLGLKSTGHGIADTASNALTNPISKTTPQTYTVTFPDITPPVILLNGITPVDVEIGSVYSDAGATASDNVDGDLTASIVTVNPVNTSLLGTYTVTYDVTDSSNNPATQVIRTVNVIDITAPEILLNGITPPLEVGVDTYIELGANVTDNDPNYSGTVTIGGDTVNENIISNYTVTYNAPADAAGNIPTEATRIVIVQDTIAPVITVNSTQVNIDAGSPQPNLLDGVTTDDGSPITTTGTVDTQTVGDYLITYDSTDGTNDADSVTRTYHVIEPVIPTKPAPPTDLTAISRDTQIKLSWTPPTDTGNIPLNHYKIQYRNDDGQTTYEYTANANITSIVINDLTNYKGYWFFVRAVNDVGQSPYDKIKEVPTVSSQTDIAKPAAPTDLIAVSGDTQVTLSWIAPTETGNIPLLNYKVQYTGDDGNRKIEYTENADTTTITITGLTNHKGYTFFIYAVNGLGQSPYDTVRAVPNADGQSNPTISQAPENITVVNGDTQITLSWSAPADTGNIPLTDYKIKYRDENGNWIKQYMGSPDITTITITGLINDENYIFHVNAVNGMGQSPDATIHGIPNIDGNSDLSKSDPPTDLTAIIGDGQVILSWVAPLDTGNTPLTDYKIRYFDDPAQEQIVFTGSPDITTITITGLTNDVEYTFQVRAENGMGYSQPDVVHVTPTAN